ncbi:hypothetical protein BDQ17DRAFT_1030149 [Cyathus striatus]|nr:hypothetical protein BDQ17DRAFT_1030149 [Cyathus striatus]
MNLTSNFAASLYNSPHLPHFFHLPSSTPLASHPIIHVGSSHSMHTPLRTTPCAFDVASRIYAFL